MANEAFPPGRSCLTCQGDGSWRCLTCLGCPLMCLKCCRESHQIQPLHRVQHWNGTFFQDAWLYQAGVKLYFGHHGARCPSLTYDSDHSSPASENGSLDPGEHDEAEDLDLSQSGIDGELDLHVIDDGLTQEEMDSARDFQSSEADPCWTKRKDGDGDPYLIVVDRSRIHLLGAVWCQCRDRVQADLQALDLRLFPASSGQIRTVFTFDCLDDFLADNQECNTTAYQYWEKLRRFTNPYFPDTVPVRYLLHYLPVT